MVSQNTETACVANHKSAQTINPRVDGNIRR
jgi:hypothetical protein